MAGVNKTPNDTDESEMAKRIVARAIASSAVYNTNSTLIFSAVADCDHLLPSSLNDLVSGIVRVARFPRVEANRYGSQRGADVVFSWRLDVSSIDSGPRKNCSNIRGKRRGRGVSEGRPPNRKSLRL